MSSFAAQRPAILGGAPIRPVALPAWPMNDETVRTVIEGMAQSGEWGRYHGPHAPELIRCLSEYHDVEHVLLCSSGTCAVELALRALSLERQDEVILAAYDFKANFQNVLCVGAVPVLVDLLPSTWQLDPDQISRAISPHTRAIIVSHLHGAVVEMPKVRQIADDRKIALIEDACQNPGALLFGRRSGTWGDVGVLSFGGSKLLTAGRGGAVMTRHTDLAERIKRYALRGNDAYPLSEMQAAVLKPQLEKLDASNEQRRNAVQQIHSQLTGMPGLTILQLPDDALQPAYYKVGIRYDPDEFGGLSRDLFAEAIRAEGIAIDAGFRSLHLVHASRRFRASGALLEAERADQQMLVLHHPVLLEGDSAIEQVAQAIRKVHAHAREIRDRNPSVTP